MVLSTATPDKTAELTWEIARLFPAQGHWSEEEYLALDTNHLTEFSHGRMEVLPLPTFSHQRLVALLYRCSQDLSKSAVWVSSCLPPCEFNSGKGNSESRISSFMAAEHADRLGEQFWRGADLVMEIVSPDDPERDKVTKRREYAQAGIPEYWIVDPTEASITVLTLQGQEYALHGEFAAGEAASSVLLEGFKVDVDDVFSEASR